MIREVTLKNFRCFGERQTARLAPLTLLVGENSTGKTSFLAMMRALWDVAFLHTTPDFKKDPYDLGSFDEIAHSRGGRAGRADSFEAGLTVDPESAKETNWISDPIRFDVKFGPSGAAPIPVARKLSNGETWLEERRGEDLSQIRFQICKGRTIDWLDSPDSLSEVRELRYGGRLVPLDAFVYGTFGRKNPREPRDSVDAEKLIFLVAEFEFGYFDRIRPYAGASVRSKPRRTYEPSLLVQDPEGEYTPMYLAHLHFRGGEEWERLKDALETFGRDAGLFDEISIRRWGRTEGAPFQIQTRKYGKRAKGPHRNLIDVGYGVSQVLPVITELLREEAPRLFLLQQPEVHLHPRAQAALGSLFCAHAGPERQFVIETHSDQLLDRVCMDVRDGKTGLGPEDVSILFFERRDLDVRIHSIGLDEAGQVVDPPPSYRRFFMDEVNRRLRF